MLLKPAQQPQLNAENQQEYQIVQVDYNFKEDKYSLSFQEWPEEGKKQLISETKPHTLRSVASKCITINDRLYIIHNLCQKDPNQSKTANKHPVRIMEFEERKLHRVEYLNDDSTGTQTGEENTKKATILPLIHRINYSLCHFKNKVFIYGGLSEKVANGPRSEPKTDAERDKEKKEKEKKEKEEKEGKKPAEVEEPQPEVVEVGNQVLSSMEIFDPFNFKF